MQGRLVLTEVIDAFHVLKAFIQATGLLTRVKNVQQGVFRMELTQTVVCGKNDILRIFVFHFLNYNL